MINWTALLTNSLWLIALASALAIAGWAAWQAAQEKTPFPVVIRRRPSMLALSGCMGLFCLGVALSVQTTWEKIAWAILALLTMIQFAIFLRNNDTNGQR